MQGRAVGQAAVKSLCEIYIRNHKAKEVDTLYGNWLGGVGVQCYFVTSIATSWYDLDLTFIIAIVTLIFKILGGYISETVRYRKLILGRDIG